MKHCFFLERKTPQLYLHNAYSLSLNDFVCRQWIFSTFVCQIEEKTLTNFIGSSNDRWHFPGRFYELDKLIDHLKGTFMYKILNCSDQLDNSSWFADILLGVQSTDQHTQTDHPVCQNVWITATKCWSYALFFVSAVFFQFTKCYWISSLRLSTFYAADE